MNSNVKGAEHEVGLFAVYCGALDRCFLLPVQPLGDKTVGYLRLTHGRNGEQACINLADDFTFVGAVAQLARATRWQRVGQGFESPQLHSNPDGAALTIGAGARRNSFGCWLDRVPAGQDVVVTRRRKPTVKLAAVARASVPARHKPEVPLLLPPLTGAGPG